MSGEREVLGSAPGPSAVGRLENDSCRLLCSEKAPGSLFGCPVVGPSCDTERVSFLVPGSAALLCPVHAAKHLSV